MGAFVLFVLLFLAGSQAVTPKSVDDLLGSQEFEERFAANQAELDRLKQLFPGSLEEQKPVEEVEVVGETLLKNAGTTEPAKEFQASEIDLLNEKNLHFLAQTAVPLKNRLLRLINKLRNTEDFTTVKLFSPVPNGDSIRFELVHGSLDTVKEVCASLGLTLTDNFITFTQDDPVFGTADGSAVKVDTKEQQRIPQDAAKELPPKELKELTTANEQLAAVLNEESAKKLKDFLQVLKVGNIIIRLYNAVPKGHIVDYEFLNGSGQELADIANRLSIRITSTQIILPAADDTVEATADEVSSFEADTVIPGAGKPI